MTDYRFISLNNTVASIIGSDEGYGTNFGMLWAVVLITSLLHVSYLVLADVVCYACMLLSMYNIVIEYAYISQEYHCMSLITDLRFAVQTHRTSSVREWSN